MVQAGRLVANNKLNTRRRVAGLADKVYRPVTQLAAVRKEPPRMAVDSVDRKGRRTVMTVAIHVTDVLTVLPSKGDSNMMYDKRIVDK